MTEAESPNLKIHGELLSHNLLKLFVSSVKQVTYGRDKNYLSEFLKANGFTGILVGLEKYYTMNDLHDVLYEIWDEFD